MIINPKVDPKTSKKWVTIILGFKDQGEPVLTFNQWNEKIKD